MEMKKKYIYISDLAAQTALSLYCVDTYHNIINIFMH